MYPGGKWVPGPARFGVEVVEDVPVTMDDGVVLNASIAYPTDLASGRRARGTFPVVIEHMPYVQFAVSVKVNPFFAEHGDISVQVRARGLGKSGGDMQFLSPREGLDGKAIIDWAAHRLDGSDGRVGLIGCSWPGAIAMTGAAAVGPDSPLKAAVAACSGMENMHRQSWLNAGLPTMSFWQFVERGAPLTGNSAAGQRYFKRFADSVLSGGDMAYDADYWRDRGRATLARRIVDNGVPMLLWAGWGDMVETGTVPWPWPLLARDEYLTPNRDYRFDLALAPRQWGLRPGHRLRLELTTQTPADRCPPTGPTPLADSDPCRLTGPQERTVHGGVYAIGLGGAMPSTLNLPMLPYQHFPAVRAAVLSHPWNEGQRAIGGPDAEPFALPLEWGGEGRDAGATDAVHATATTTADRTAYPGGRWQPPPASYAAGAANDTTIALADGTRLAATVAYPVDTASGARATGPFPVIVEFTPYLRLGQPVGVIPYFVERGYIHAVVRPRGTGGSTGQMQQFTSQDGRDGAAVVDWAAALEDADGRVAMAGCSYPAATALATAAAARKDSPLKVVVAACIGLDMQHRQVWTSNGLPNAALSAYAPRAGAMMGEQPSVTGYFADFLKGVMAGGPEAYDGYWQDRLPLSRAADIVANGIPVLLWTGWSDINEIGGLHAYHALQNAAAGRPVDALMDTARTDPRWQIIVGDWSHAQGLDVGVYLQWFETWLKGIDTGIARTATPMHVYEKGTGRWVNLAGYPVARTSTRLQFGPGGTLAEAMPANNGSAQLRWGSPEASDGSVAFTSEPFAEGATIAGPISATIYAASSNTNLELIANLYDVAPNGEAQRISIGALLGSQSRLDPERSWRDDAGTMTWPWPLLLRDEYLQPDRVQRFDLFLALRQWGLAPGHRVRLVLTTQSPASVCPPEGEPTFVSEPCRLTAPQQATLPGGVYRIGFGEGQPSSLNLPLLPYRAFATAESGPTPTRWDETNRRMAPATTTLPLDWGR